MVARVDTEDRICFVNCGLSGEDCACFRSMFKDLMEDQKPLGRDIEKAVLDDLEWRQGA